MLLSLSRSYKKFISLNMHNQFHNTYILQHFDYCCIVWRSCTHSLEDKSVQFQKRSATIIFEKKMLLHLRSDFITVKFDDFWTIHNTRMFILLLFYGDLFQFQLKFKHDIYIDTLYSNYNDRNNAFFTWLKKSQIIMRNICAVDSNFNIIVRHFLQHNIFACANES